MRRKETFGTSGVRIQARLFGGWDLPDLCASNDMIAEAYETGVPMGSVLPPREGSEPPRFFVTALADPGTSAYSGTPLQRIQIIKGWVGDNGLFHDVAGDADNGADVSRDTLRTQRDRRRVAVRRLDRSRFRPVPLGRLLRAGRREPELPLERTAVRGPARGGAPGRVRRSRPDPDQPWTIQQRAWTSPIWYQATDR